MPPTPDTATLAPAPPPRRRRTVRWLVTALLAAGLAAGAAVVVVRHRPAPPAPVEETVAVGTAAVERRDLSTTRSLTGRIGFGAARPLSGHRDGTVTWLPQPGATIKRGKQLFRADDQPVPLFYGGMPLYREIAGVNLVGRDVRIVADNLAKLGYAVGHRPAPGEWVTQPAPPAETTETPDKEDEPATRGVRVKEGEGVLTAALTRAIKRWQNDTGLPVTGTVAVGDVEVQSGAVRVEAVTVQPGSPANAELMTVTPTRRVITADAQLADAATVKRGTRVTVALPGDRTVQARVVSVGRTLAPAADGVGTGPPTLTVTITADDPADLGDLDAADVEVAFAGRTAEDVLAVPVEALVALAEGGYAVQGPAGLVAVRTGMFADGWVEVEGAGLTEGTGVVVSS